MFLSVFLSVVALLGCNDAALAPPKPESQFPSPMHEHTRSHDRLDKIDVSDRVTSVEGVLPRAVEIFVPERYDEGRSDILLHFHGAGYIAWTAVSRLDEPMALAVVNLGSGSSVYEQAFKDTLTFLTLLDSVRAESGTVDSGGRVYLSAFSAGYGAVRAILKDHLDRVHGLLLLDGLHTDYVPVGRRLQDGGVLNDIKMADFVRFAEQARDGRKAFILTHSEIFPGTYASTTETAQFILDALDLRREPVVEWGPGGMQLLSRASSGSFLVLGFAGNSAPDHMDYLHNMPTFLKMMLNE